MKQQKPRVTLERIELSGFKSIDRMELDLKSINVLIGANGSGKSNFVSFFQLLDKVQEAGLEDYVVANGGADAILHDGSKLNRKILSKLRIGVEGEKAWLYLTLAYRPPDSLACGVPDFGRATSKKRHVGLVFGVRRDEESPEFPHAFHDALLRGIGVYHFHDTSLAGPMRKSAEIADNQRLHSDAGNLPAMLYLYRELEKKQKREHPNKRYLGSAYARIKMVVKKLFPCFHDFVLEPERLNEHRILLRWRQEGSEYVFGPHQLSDGTLRAIALATLLLQPPKDLPSLIVIDEPELGLHPLGIELIAGLVRAVSLECQVILATQSTTLLDFFDPEDIVVAEAQGGASRFRRLNREELTDWLRTYTVSELWQKNVLGGGPLS